MNAGSSKFEAVRENMKCLEDVVGNLAKEHTELEKHQSEFKIFVNKTILGWSECVKIKNSDQKVK